MREESRKVSIAAMVTEHPVALPDTAYAMWVRDELSDFLHLPCDRTRVEVIAGEIVVSPGPSARHERSIKDIQRAFIAAQLAEPGFAWEITTLDLKLGESEEGYIPDLIVLQAEVLAAIEQANDMHVLASQAEMVVEATSRSTARVDRKPTLRRPSTKWTGYARTGIPLYLLIDRDPKVQEITLYSAPDRAAGTYLQMRSWQFGESVQLEHFDVEIDTSGWMPWKD